MIPKGTPDRGHDATEAFRLDLVRIGLDKPCKVHQTPQWSCGFCLWEALTALQARVQALERDLSVCQQIDDTFWEALKPLNLPAIYVQNPGQHVTDLIAKVQALEREVARLTELNRLEPMGDTPNDMPQPIEVARIERGRKIEPDVAPIPLNEAQAQAAQEWAADDRLWTTQETVEFNLRTFARVILSRLS
jgi:hypothetical protein